MIVNGFEIKPRANLVGAELSGKYLICVNLRGANLIGANLVQANLSYANLTDAVLSGANMYGTDLSRAIGYDKKRIIAKRRCENLTARLDNRFWK